MLYSAGDENEESEDDPMRINMEIIQDIPVPKHYHYMWLKDVSRLFRSQLTQCAHAKLFLCNRCLNHFKSELT